MRPEESGMSHPCTHMGLQNQASSCFWANWGFDKNHIFASWPEYPKIKCLLPAWKQVITHQKWINWSLRKGLKTALWIWVMFSSGSWEPSVLGTLLTSHAQAEQHWNSLHTEESARGTQGPRPNLNLRSWFLKLENKMTWEEPSKWNPKWILWFWRQRMWSWEYSSTEL